MPSPERRCPPWLAPSDLVPAGPATYAVSYRGVLAQAWAVAGEPLVLILRTSGEGISLSLLDRLVLDTEDDGA